MLPVSTTTGAGSNGSTDTMAAAQVQTPARAGKSVSPRQRIADAGNTIANALANETVRKAFAAARDSVKRSDLTGDKTDSVARSIERIDKADLAGVAQRLAKLASALKIVATGKADERRGANIRTRLGSISADAYLVRLADASGKADQLAELASE